MANPETVEVVAAITATLHDGTSMIVLSQGKAVTVARSSLAFLKSKDAIAGGNLPQLDHDDDGAPGGSEPHKPVALTGKNKQSLLEIAEQEGVVTDDSMTNSEIVAAIEDARIAADSAPL